MLARIGTSFVLLAAFCWGLAGVIAGCLMAGGWDPFVLSFYRGAIGLLVVALWLAAKPGGSGLDRYRLWFWSIVAGLGISGNFAFYFLSIEAGSVAVAATLMYCAPIYVYLVSFALRWERPTLPKCAAMLMTVLGIVLLTRVHDIGSGDISGFAVVAGLLSGAAYAVFIFGFKKAVPCGQPQAILTIAFAVLVGLLVGPADNEQLLAVLHSPKWPLFAILGVVGAGFSFFLYIVGLQHTTPAVASVVAMLEPVTASACGVLFLGERLRGLQILGMIVILATVTALSWYSNQGTSEKLNAS
jgi:drug/metabolite transporter (DMT)-like permease